MVRPRRFPFAPFYAPWEPCSSAFLSFLQDNHCHPVTWCCFFSQTGCECQLPNSYPFNTPQTSKVSFLL